MIATILIALGVGQLRRLRHPAPRRTSGRRAFVIGLIHGLAGSGAIALAAMTTIAAPTDALAYLGTFALGVVAGMAALTAALALPIVWSARRARAQAWLVAGAAALSIAAGAAIAIAQLST